MFSCSRFTLQASRFTEDDCYPFTDLEGES